MPLLPLKTVLDIDPYKGGESTLPGVAKPIKLASNENPFGASPKAKEAAIAAMANTGLYPEGSAAVLRNALATRYGLDPGRIVCGAGSDEIFQLLLRAYLGPGDEIVQSEHAFLMYRIFARPMGGVVKTAKNEGKRANVDSMLDCVTEKTRIVFLDNPNNPTGTYLPFSEVRRLHAELPDNVMLVIDAAYAEYVNRNDYSAGIELAGEAENVVMTRTFSKIHGLAAMRVGWMYGPASVVDALNRVRLPFNVATPAQAAAAAAIADGAFMEMSARHNEKELERVSGAIAAMGFEVIPSVGNFVLAAFPIEKGRTAGDADKHLRSRGIIVRGVAAYGLPDALRISIGSEAQNDAFLKALGEFAGK
ncbi:MAG: histidinol-phosphate transaminase [Hyphomonadaceae bacterium]|nr:histidinol-phosphate transaminase [Hyphomonadaceae bacterium]